MLKISQLSVCYGAIEALRKVDLHIELGEIVALIGSNGAGKTTLLRTISGLLRPSAGSVVYEGEELTRLAPEQIVRRGIAHVPEGRLIFQNLSVAENLTLGAYLHRDGIREERDKIFELFPRLRERLKQNAGTLSGGEQQMLAIARALMSRPRLLLLDEPSLGISPILTEQIFSKLREINQNGVTLLLVEQNAQLALTTSQRAYVLENGELRKSGPADELLHDPGVRHAYLGMS